MVEIVGVILGLLGTYLLAGEYLLGQRIKQLEEWLNKLANTASYYSERKTSFLRSRSAHHMSWNQYKHYLVRQAVVDATFVVLCIFFLNKALAKFIPIYLNIPVTLFGTFVAWFLFSCVFIAITVAPHRFRIEGRRLFYSHEQASWFLAVPLFILEVYILLFRSVGLYRFTLGSCIRPVKEILLFPLRNIKLFGQRYNLGYLSALLGAILLIVGVILVVIS